MYNKVSQKKLFSFVSFFTSIIVGFMAMFMPPEGVIDNSVLWFIAQLLIFTSTILGIDFRIDKNI